MINHEHPWQKYGELYGYPQCCIDAFISGESQLYKSDKHFKGCGYLPCSKCDQKTSEELLEVIKANRKFPRPFPEDDISYYVRYKNKPKYF